MAASVSLAVPTSIAGRFVDLQPAVAESCLLRRRSGLNRGLEKAIAALAVLEAPQAKEEDAEGQNIGDWTEDFLNSFAERCRQLGGKIGEDAFWREDCHADAVGCAWFPKDLESALNAVVATREALLSVSVDFEVCLRLSVGHHEYAAFTTMRRSEPAVIGVSPKLWAKLSQKKRESFVNLGCAPPDDDEIARRAEQLLASKTSATLMEDTVR